MSLIVYLLSKHADFDLSDLEKLIPYPNNDLFGFESTRKTLWGHPVMSVLKCPLIQGLERHNIYAFGEDALALKAELLLIQDNIDLVSSETGYDVEFIAFRISNALAAIQIVEQNFDHVGVAIE